jgi:hypothetical protein
MIDFETQNKLRIENAYNDRLLCPFSMDTGRNLFRISFKDQSGKVYIPEIPIHRAVCEDNTIARVCFADTVEGCFRAIPDSPHYIDKGSYSDPSVYKAHIFVHVPVVNKHFLRAIDEGLVAYPHSKLVPDVYMTQEVWVMDYVEVKCIAEMYAWFDASDNPGFMDVNELPVCLELIDCYFNDQDWLTEILFKHPDYIRAMYEM